MKLNCIIVDDEPVARKILEEYVAEVNFLVNVGVAENPIQAGAILKGHEVDLMFMDINMPKMSGLEFLRAETSKPATIITTAYREYAIEGFELDVLDYLVKPFSFERFLKAVNKAKEYYERTRSAEMAHTPFNYFFIKVNGRFEKIFYDDLICVESMQNYVTLHTNEGKRIAYLTLKSVESQLPGEIFIKIHKSSIINMNKIKSITGKIIDLGLMQVTISQTMFDEVMNKIMKDRLLKR
jgi:DNA-binding LytR/AlgR family response regulator